MRKGRSRKEKAKTMTKTEKKKKKKKKRRRMMRRKTKKTTTRKRMMIVDEKSRVGIASLMSKRKLIMMMRSLRTRKPRSYFERMDLLRMTAWRSRGRLSSRRLPITSVWITCVARKRR